MQPAIGVDGNPAADLELAPRHESVLLAVGAEPALGEVHQLGAGLGVLQLGDVDLARADPRRFERCRPA